MEGLVDNRPQQIALDAPEDPSPEDQRRATEATSPRAVKVVFTPVTNSTLVTVVTTEWRGRSRIEHRVLAERVQGVARLDWSIAPHAALAACIRALAVYLDA